MKRTHVPAASLLSILLLISVVGIIILAATRALTESTRASSNQSALDEARVAAFTGLSEGLKYLKAGTQLTEGEFGDMSRMSSTSYSLEPRVGGFKLDSEGNCTVQTFDTTGDNTMDLGHCPSYELAIRTKVAYGQGAGKIESLQLSSQDFPQGVEVFVPYALNGNVLQLKVSELLPQNTTATIRECTTNTISTAQCDPASGALTPGSVYSPSQSTSTKFLGITMSYGATLSKPQTIFSGFGATPTQDAVLGKGYTTIDVTGYSIGGKSGGGVVVRYVYALRNGVPYRTETTGSFNSKGVFNQ